MANNLLTNNIVIKEALPILRNKLPMVSMVNKQFQEEITNSNNRVGGVINYKRPPRYLGRQGELMQIESTVETSRPLVLQQAGVDVSFSLKDLQLSMDEVRNGGLTTVLEPAMTAIAAQIELAGTSLYKGIATTVGTPGTPPTTSTVIANANAYITAAGGTIGAKRAAIVDPFTDASLADQLSLRFNPTANQSQAYMSGRMGEALGFEFYDSPAIQTHTAGVYGGTPAVNGASQTGSSLITNGWTAGSILNQGDVIKIVGVNYSNPQTRSDTGQVAFFAVAATTTADGSGNMTIPLYSPITPSGQFQTVATAPANGALITVTSGTSGQKSRQNLLFDPWAFTFASTPMALPSGGVYYAGQKTDKMSGLSISCISDYDIKNNQVLTRFDVLYGWDLAYPELAVRLEAQEK